MDTVFEPQLILKRGLIVHNSDGTTELPNEVKWGFGRSLILTYEKTSFPSKSEDIKVYHCRSDSKSEILFDEILHTKILIMQRHARTHTHTQSITIHWLLYKSPGFSEFQYKSHLYLSPMFHYHYCVLVMKRSMISLYTVIFQLLIKC